MINTNITLEELNKMGVNTMGEHLGIVFTEVGANYICGTMPVDHRTIQPMGLLHGGASAVLAETLGSIGSYLCVDIKTQACVGLNISCNHIRAAKDGFVTGKAVLIHEGGKTHIWNIDITNDKQQLICSSRLTVMVLDKK
ncbi:MAG: hotdog fold thioesterase [Cytophaga sp.]|uniref:hotdog fold thioesterase n=1 Tax=Cytophaga sp. TaxID=29535 RepID=UPI003F7CF003